MLAVLGPAVVLWPLPLLAARGALGRPTALLTDPGGEAVVHLWSWVASQDAGSLLSAHSPWLNAPEGLDLQVIDPLHGLVYALGAGLGGPAAGWAAVCWLGLSVCAVGAVGLAREAAAPPVGGWVAAAVGLAVPTVLASVVDGITEGLGAGWVALQLALLLRLGRTRSGRDAGLLAAVLAAGVHTGVYNGVWMAFLDVPIAVWLLWRRRAWRPLVAGAAAASVAAPYLLAALRIAEGRPGAGGRGAPLPPDARAPHWRGSWMEGADVLDLFVPAPLTGAAPWATTAYLGAVLLVLVAVSAWQRPRAALPWCLGAAVFASLALGPFVVVGGAVTGLPSPASLLELTPLGRLTRWYRAGAVCVLLLAPVAASVSRRRSVALGAALLLLVDGRFGGPLPAVLPTTPVPMATVLSELPGPFAEQPAVFPVRQPGTTADLNLLLQVLHRTPSSGTVDAVPGVATDAPAMRALQRCLAVPPGSLGEDLCADAAGGLVALGYRSVVLYRSGLARPLVHPGEPSLRATLGPPLAEDALVRVYALVATGR